MAANYHYPPGSRYPRFGPGLERIPPSGLPHNWESFDRFAQMNQNPGRLRRFGEKAAAAVGLPASAAAVAPNPVAVMSAMPGVGLAAQGAVAAASRRFGNRPAPVDSRIFGVPQRAAHGGYEALIDTPRGPRIVNTIPPASVSERDTYGPRFGIMTPEQRRAAIMALPLLRPSGTEIGRDRYDAGGNKIISTVPGAPQGTIAEYDPTRDRNRNRFGISAEERRRLPIPTNAGRALWIDPQYLNPGDSAVGYAIPSSEQVARQKALSAQHAAFLAGRAEQAVSPTEPPPIPGLRFGLPDFGRAARDAALAARGVINGANAAAGATAAANIGRSIGRRFGEIPKTAAGMAHVAAQGIYDRANQEATDRAASADATAVQKMNEIRKRWETERLRREAQAIQAGGYTPGRTNPRNLPASGIEDGFNMGP